MNCQNSPQSLVTSDTFPFLDEQQGLREHWYPLCFSKDVKTDRPNRHIAFSVPIMVWRNDKDELNAFLDVCPHRQAQLSLGSVSADGISCPYHGWRFDHSGTCNHVPVAPDDCLPNEPARLTSIPVHEDSGTIWIWLGSQQATTPPQYLSKITKSGDWKLIRVSRVLNFDLDDLIENFMDFAHTAVVHPGLIRGITNPEERGVEIETGADFVKATHDPANEKVGFLSSIFQPKNKPVQHSDKFVLPGNVQVEYWFGNEPTKFFAFLGMTPVSHLETRVLVTVGVKFGWLNTPMALALPSLIHRVLKQDEQILAQQRENLDLISKRKSRSLRSDAVDSIVRSMRGNEKNPTSTRPKPGTQTMRVMV
jgi:phenylpropionate dioxygenase-like ring-hydroxylating dioxygenase large terminal subunit